jgi:hypothetical protein
VTARSAGLAGGLYLAIVIALSIGVHAWVALAPDPGHPRAIVASVWRAGELVARAMLPNQDAHDPAIDEAVGAPDSELVFESIVAEGPILGRPELALANSLVSGHDGVVAHLDGATAVVTPDDLLARRAYDRGSKVLGVDLPSGADTAVLFAILGERLHATARRVEDEATFRRIRVARSTPLRAKTPWAEVDGPRLTTDDVRGAAHDAARYLAKNIRHDGHFRYLVDATNDHDLPGYDWPRHAGATYFLAQAAAHFHDKDLGAACLSAAALMRDRAISRCGSNACIGRDSHVDLGSSALALLAFVEIARTGLDPTYEELVRQLTAFVRGQQRPDGEFMHEYDRSAGHPIDVQYVYYSGEATLALARAHVLTREPLDLAAAVSGLSHIVGPAWRFFGNRYYFGEEHWTCQAMAELWERSPDASALDFCRRWQAYGRKLQFRAGEAVYDADGAIGVGPFATPRLTPVASRCEAGLATLEAFLRSGAAQGDEKLQGEGGDREKNELEAQQRRALALLVRRQLRPGPVAILADPDRVYGAMPGSEVDLALRIDYAQHAGSAMIRWLDLEEPAGAGSTPPAAP